MSDKTELQWLIQNLYPEEQFSNKELTKMERDVINFFSLLVNEYMKQDYKPPMKTVFNRYGELERDRNYPVPSKPKKKYDPYANTKSQYSQSELKKAYKPRQTYNNWN